MEDTFRHKGLRKKLIDLLMDKGISNQQVLEAMSKVPRHFFIESYLDTRAYSDVALPLSDSQTISQPYTVAFQTELLDVQKGDRILEIGTGSGYQTAILLELGAKVYSVERIKNLHIKALNLMNQIKYFPSLFYGDGFDGLPRYAPFDKILITAGVAQIPNEILKQLKPGGRLVAPIGDSSAQVMTLIVRKSENEYTKTSYGEFVFVPMLKGVIK
jgi:protein-L-isoaspartate(D-aspartate) O-methyltransferase